MYDFIYLFFVQYFKWKKDNGDPKDSAIYGVMTAVIMHLFFIYAVVLFFTHVNILAEIFGANHSKYFWLPLAFLIMYVVNYIYKRRSIVLLEKADKDKNLLTLKNVILIILLIVGPVVLGVQFLNQTPLVRSIFPAFVIER